MSVIVTGASGQLGRLVIDHLLATVPASEVTAVVRDPAKAATSPPGESPSPSRTTTHRSRSTGCCGPATGYC